MLGLLLLPVLASCLWLGHSEVVKSFRSCSQFFYLSTAPTFTLVEDNPAKICQHYNNSYRFATLYDRGRRIPVYSAYIYQPGYGSRLDHWFVEPQLIKQNYPSDMDTEDSLQIKHKITASRIGQRQAINQDYYNLRYYNRGHLSPSRHQSGNNTKWATFTLTNVVPQDETLNEGAWNDYENSTMRQLTQGCTTTYVITGAVPGKNYISNNRVNVPSHIWSAACCQTNTTPKTWAVIAENNRKNQVQNLTLGQLEARLNLLYRWGQVRLFHSDCPR